MAIIKDGKTDIADRLRATAEDLVELVSAQVKLVRLELLGDARAVGRRLTRFAIYLPLLVLGYGFLAAAASWGLAHYLGVGWALALVGAVHVLVGSWGVVRAARSLGEVRVLERSGEEIERSLERVAPVAARSSTDIAKI
jgi:hypothetical protein